MSKEKKSLRYFYHESGLTSLTSYFEDGSSIEFSPYIVVDPNRGKVTYMMAAAEYESDRYKKLLYLKDKLNLIETDSPLIFASESDEVSNTPKRISQVKTSSDKNTEKTVVKTNDEPKPLTESDIRDLLLEDDK